MGLTYALLNKYLKIRYRTYEFLDNSNAITHVAGGKRMYEDDSFAQQHPNISTGPLMSAEFVSIPSATRLKPVDNCIDTIIGKLNNRVLESCSAIIIIRILYILIDSDAVSTNNGTTSIQPAPVRAEAVAAVPLAANFSNEFPQNGTGMPNAESIAKQSVLDPQKIISDCSLGAIRFALGMLPVDSKLSCMIDMLRVADIYRTGKKPRISEIY